ncbi:hypothetical protein AKJ41_06160 [candidate division MSBL1 archaeon SCGC-AAA259O05]|uniref:Uncharacterized protein n=1 Tax=candidate division MSBL1 archaeon SCGC-AAA259O05 TaxID=1698271 RepID=A0A133UXT5_9EURY|nr:hypothetical protein AKJ41_06160 [candidate division MSBL1 archaeon SCGC-AAA259O05]
MQRRSGRAENEQGKEKNYKKRKNRYGSEKRNAKKGEEGEKREEGEWRESRVPLLAFPSLIHLCRLGSSLLRGKCQKRRYLSLKHPAGGGK